MKLIICAVVLICGAGPLWAVPAGSSGNPFTVIETAPKSNSDFTGLVAGSTAAVGAVTVSSFTITGIDTDFNTVASSALGTDYSRGEITVQNNGTTECYCGYSSADLTTSNSFKIRIGDTWSFKLGKGIGVYCLNAAGSSGTLIVGGVAWR